MSMLPLIDIRVVEFCNVAAGPFCGMLLADMGADVIKVEKPGGDDLRHWPPVSEGFSENFASVNRNKRSIVLDLKSNSDVLIAQRLCAKADVIIENNRPGAMQRLGLGYDRLKDVNPKLIYCSISAFGQSGPGADSGGFDLTIQAISGIMSVTGDETGVPIKCGVPVSDFAAGLYGAYAVAAALLKRNVTEKGEYIDVSMLGASLGISALQTSEFFGTGKNAPPMGSRHPRNAPYQAFKAKDRYFVMAAGNDKLWASVCLVVGRMDLMNMHDYATPAARAQNQKSLAILLEQCFATELAETWIHRFTKAGVPCAPINTFGDALSHPQVEHSGWIQPMTLPNGVETQTFASPVKFDGDESCLRRMPPALNQHYDEIIDEL